LRHAQLCPRRNTGSKPHGGDGSAGPISRAAFVQVHARVIAKLITIGDVNLATIRLQKRKKHQSKKSSELTMRPTGLDSGIDKDRPDYSVFSGEWEIGRTECHSRPTKR
jgi:hypothetical protein